MLRDEHQYVFPRLTPSVFTAHQNFFLRDFLVIPDCILPPSTGSSRTSVSGHHHQTNQPNTEGRGRDYLANVFIRNYQLPPFRHTPPEIRDVVTGAEDVQSPWQHVLS